MGIDVYLRWDGQTKEEEQAQYTGFSIVHGHVGYLREAYHGEPYATRVLIPESDGEQPENGFVISSSALRIRLPATLEAAKVRQKKVYGDGPKKKLTKLAMKSFEDFVTLHEEREKEGKNPRIIVSG